MKISDAQYERIAGYFPVQRGNVKTDNRDFINAILYIAENGCKWRALPAEFGKWQTIYKKFSRWAKSGVLQRIFAALQTEEIIAIRVSSGECHDGPEGRILIEKIRDGFPGTSLLMNPRTIGKSRGNTTKKRIKDETLLKDCFAD